MKVLAIRLARFGDIVLLLPALTWLKTQLPGSHLTFLTDERWEPLAALCPAIDKVIGINRLEMRDGSLLNAAGGIRRLEKKLREGGFDLAIDCHGFREAALMAWWSGAPKRLGLQRFDQAYLGFCFNLPPVVEDKSLHVSEMFQRLLRGLVPGTPAPAVRANALVIPEAAREWVRSNAPPPPYAVLYIDAPVPERVWPEERFAELARHIVQNLGARVVVVSGSRRPTQVFGEGVQLLSDLPIERLAAVIGSGRMLVSNDTGPMHLGPALGVPTLGIFSVGIPQHFRPFGPLDLFVQGNPIESVETGRVVEEAEGLWRSSGR